MPEEHNIGMVEKLITFKPPDYDFMFELDVPVAGDIGWSHTFPHHTVIHGKFYSASDDIEGLTLHYSIYNATDRVTIDHGEFTPAESNFWHKQSNNFLADDLRGKTIQFRFWNPSENNVKSLKIHGILYISKFYSG